MLARNSFPGDPNRAAGNPQHVQAEWNKILASQRNQNQQSNTAERNLRLQRAANARAAGWYGQKTAPSTSPARSVGSPPPPPPSGGAIGYAQQSQRRVQASPQQRSYGQQVQHKAQTQVKTQTQVRSRGR